MWISYSVSRGLSNVDGVNTMYDSPGEHIVVPLGVKLIEGLVDTSTIDESVLVHPSRFPMV